MNHTERNAREQAHARAQELDELLNTLQAGVLRHCEPRGQDATPSTHIATEDAALAQQLVELSARTELNPTFTQSLHARLQHAHHWEPTLRQAQGALSLWQALITSLKHFEMNHKYIFVSSIVSLAIVIGVAIATPLVMQDNDLAKSLPVLPAAPFAPFLPVAQSTDAPQGAPTAGAPLLVPSITTPPAPNLMQRMNILVMGLDRRPDEQGASRTDTMMIVSIALMSQTVSLLSLPRDLWVTIPGYDDDRINTAYLIGETQRYPGRGPALAKATVQANFGVPIHYYVIVDFVGFRRLVDELGGIDVDVPQDIRDETFPDDHDGYRMVYIPQGRWHLSGDLALDYVRTRHQDADFGRMRRQQQVMLALKDRALQTNTLAKLPTLWSLKSEVVQTDLSMDKALELAALAKDLPAANIHAVTIDEKMTTPMLVASSGAQVLWPDRAKIREVVEQLFR